MSAREKIVGSSIVLSILMPAPGAAQDIKRPPLNVRATADSPQQFVPEGWQLESERLLEGDLNSDGRPDLAFMISHGGANSSSAEEAVVKHVLVLALRGDDGKLHRSMVSDSAVLDGDEGGAFGDPFDDLSIDKGTVAISHYGGSRQRWGFTHRYRFQNGKWTLIALGLGSTDTLDLEHYDNQDINLSTGFVEASEAGGYDGEPKKPETSGAYYELQVLPAESAPQIDGVISGTEWIGYTIRLDERETGLLNRKLWRAADDRISANIHSLRRGDDLFLGLEVSDNQFTGGDKVRLVNRRGVEIKPIESKLKRVAKGYVYEARFSLRKIAAALKRYERYIVENLEMALAPSGPYGDFQGFAMPVSLEVVDTDRAPRRRVVLSTRIAGSPYPGSIRIFRPGTLELISDVKD